MRRLLAASLGAGLLIWPAAAAPRVAGHRAGCAQLFTARATRWTARWVYRGTVAVYSWELARLGYMEGCQLHPGDRRRVVAYDRRQAAQLRPDPAPPQAPAGGWDGPVTASWYDDGGSTACGFHATYGFASLTLPCGAVVQMRGPGGAVVQATMQDRGPYVGGRTFDLNPALKAALGCSDLCSVMWRSG